MLDDDDGEERNSPQPPSFAQFLQAHSFSQFSQLGTSIYSNWERQGQSKGQAQSNKVRTQAIEKFEKRIDKFLELKQKKMEIEERKLLFIDTSHMNSFQRAEHEALCNEIRKKYDFARGN
ncbi:hypothetical protein E3N88_09370 [Mikania micrantha]|uniref:No apical meristem-associated C-terminal domain-containing protein n=1 Tax=Mikania micrantha TaxID=192012 RepID=A0A5N6PIY0_9ASTR|nr:hypothetical protein E3N88_09370 [Mikania micrantha]